MNSKPMPARRQHGLTLVELMVALVIGLVIVAAMSVLFAGSSRSRREMELSADAIENGRYAVDALSRELSQTGFYGSLVRPEGTVSNAGAAMCDRGVGAIDTKWSPSLPFHVAGLRSAASANTDVDPGCVVRKAGTDAIFVQRASTCAVGEANCEAELA